MCCSHLRGAGPKERALRGGRSPGGGCRGLSASQPPPEHLRERGLCAPGHGPQATGWGCGSGSVSLWATAADTPASPGQWQHPCVPRACYEVPELAHSACIWRCFRFKAGGWDGPKL